MVKAILTTKVDPTYDDLPEERYHFPRTYLRQVEAAVGDWIVYYEPRRLNANDSSRGGRQAYFATAKLTRIEEDVAQPDHYYAFVSDFLPFDFPVPFREGEFYYESSLRREDGKTNKGAFGRSVRRIPDDEYDLILRAGFSQTLGVITPKTSSAVAIYSGVSEEELPFKRPIVEQVVTRLFRDKAFSNNVGSAYEGRCAMTGLRILNNKGYTETHAAHIRPVAEQGSDSTRNGLSLSRTIHWMFDNGLLSVADDYTILIANNKVPDKVLELLNKNGKLILPKKVEEWPHPAYLSYHRAGFKG